MASADRPLSFPPPPAVRPAVPESPALAALETLRLKRDHAQELTAVSVERDAAVAEVATLRQELAGLKDKLDFDRRVSTALREKLALLQREHASRVAECAELQTALDQRAATVPASAGEGADWESRAMAQFEADIETYRKRIRELLAEREALRVENGRLAKGAATGESEAF